MSQTTTMTVRLPAQVKARLEKLAKSTDRSRAYLASHPAPYFRMPFRFFLFCDTIPTSANAVRGGPH